MTPSPRTIAPDALAAEALHDDERAARGRSPRCSWSMPPAGRSASCTSTTCCARASHERHAPADAPCRRHRRRRPAAWSAAGAPHPPAAHASAAWRAAAGWSASPNGCCRWRHWCCWPPSRCGRRSTRDARLARDRATGASPARSGGATLTDARYRGVDEHGRPYTLTAATAQQVGAGADQPDHARRATSRCSNGTWLMVQSKHGVFLQHTEQLDLSRRRDAVSRRRHHAVHRSASLDLKNGAAAGAEPTHAEGPFGTLDAQGFTVTDKGAVDPVHRPRPAGPERASQ